MKPLRSSLVALCALAATSIAYAGPVASDPAPAPPAPAEGGFYFGVAGGALWLEDGNYGALNLDFDTGFSIIGTVGYALGNGLAFELESGYLEVDSGTVSLWGASSSVDGEFRQVPIIANVVYTLDLTDRLSVYVGGGLGLVWSDSEVNSIEKLPSLGSVDGGDEWNFAAQAKAGLSFKVTEAASINVGYRYFYGQDAIAGYDDAQGSVLEGGITIRF